MGIGFDVDFRPPMALASIQLSMFAGSIRSFREPLKRAVREVVAPSIQRNFDVGGRPQWEPLADATVTRKMSDANARSPESPLIRYRTLRRVAGQLNTWEFTQTEAKVAQLKDAEYGEFHQTGTERLPQREFMVIQPEDEDNIERVFAVWLFERAAKAGFFIT